MRRLNAMLQIAQTLNRSIDNVVDLTNTTSYKNKSLQNNNRNQNAQLPRGQHKMAQKIDTPLPKELKSTLPEVRRSPRGHTQSRLVQPIRASYHIPIPKIETKKIPHQHLSSEKLLSDILLNLHQRTKEAPDTLKNAALNNVLSWNQQAFDAFLYPTLNHIYNE